MRDVTQRPAVDPTAAYRQVEQAQEAARTQRLEQAQRERLQVQASAAPTGQAPTAGVTTTPSDAAVQATAAHAEASRLQDSGQKFAAWAQTRPVEATTATTATTTAATPDASTPQAVRRAEPTQQAASYQRQRNPTLKG